MAVKKNFSRVSHVWCGLHSYLDTNGVKEKILTKAVLKEFEKFPRDRTTPAELVYNLFGISLSKYENTSKLIKTEKYKPHLKK